MASNMASADAKLKPLHVHTPLIESYPMSQQANCDVYIKLENTQPTATFKIRGIGHLVQKAMQDGGCKKIISSSGGNAGLAAAYAAKKLKIPITIYVPGSTPQFIIHRLEGEGAEVLVEGDVWDHANAKAVQVSKQPGCVYIHPFDHPDIWEGHATMIEEVKEDLGFLPDVVVASVGGGGLMCGILRGLERVGWQDVPVVAMETVGADCFNKAIKADKLVTLPDITSVAKCLGALTVAQQALDYYKQGRVLSEVITDRECIEACIKFLDDQRMLVEPACGAALAAVYSKVLTRLQEEGKLAPVKTAVIVVCGGQTINLKQLEHWKTVVGLQ